MALEKLEEELVEILGEQLLDRHSVRQDSIRPETKLHELYIDSLDSVEIILAIEDKYGFELPSDFDKRFHDYFIRKHPDDGCIYEPSVQDMADYIRAERGVEPPKRDVKPSKLGIAIKASITKLLGS